MQGQVIVLVVSIDEEPSGLIKELSRLGVEVLFGALSDCEQLIDEHQPDLVVLFGARGAMELASLIEGHEGQTPPRMVIAADRKELAKMIGLNRDVVVSLFATESGDRVLGQRIESLARRAARRRSASIPPPPVKATQLGLPNAGLLNKLELKKSTSLEGPERLGLKSSLGSKEKNEPLRAMPQVTSTTKVVNDESTSKVVDDKAKDDTALKVSSLAAKTVELEVKKPAAPRAESVEVADDDLLSLRPSEFPDAESDLAPIPTSSAVPVEATSPPTFPPGAHDGGTSAVQLASATDDDAVTAIVTPPTGGFDISGAEAALENLENLLAQASKPMARVSSEATSASSTSSTETAPSALSDFDPLGATLLTEVHKVDVSEVPDVATSASGEVPSESSEPLSFDSLESEEADEASAGVELENSDSATPESIDAPAARAQERLVAAEIGIDTKQTAQSANKPASKSKSNVWWVPAALIAVATSLGLYMTRTKPDVHVAKGAAAAREEATAEPLAAEAEPAVSEHVDAPVDLSGEPSAEQASSTAMVNEPGAQTVSAAAASEGETASAQAAVAGAIEQPFVVADTNKPGCEVLLGEEVPQGGRDLVHQASLLWGEARKLIVAGKVNEAHKKMCGAVILNPESAAVEGLAQLYLDMFSLEQAEQWANKAEQLRPGQRDIAVLKGDIYGMRGELDKARDMWRAAFKLSENGESQLRAMSRDYGVEAGRRLRSGDIVKAEIWYRRAAILDPNNLAALMGLANTFMRSDRPSYALAFAQKALSISELIPEMQVLVGEVAFKSGQIDEARSRFEKALAIRSDFYPAKRGLSLIK